MMMKPVYNCAGKDKAAEKPHCKDYDANTVS
jgi:hypothetical protein